MGYLLVANMVRSWGPDCVITTGDNNYSVGAASTIDAHVGKGYHWCMRPYLGIYGEGQGAPSCGVHRLRVGVDVEVILTPPCIFCMDNHE